MKATIITIGDEILIGQIVDTNSASIARHLNAAGIVVAEKESVGDDRDGARVGIETDEEASVRQVAHHHLLLFVADDSDNKYCR